jgi:hypothetical protein
VDRSKLVTGGGPTKGIDLSRTFFQRGGLPNRRSKIQAKLGLILQELGPLHSRDGHAFAVIVHQKRTKRIRELC